jgi:hypothetical protein
MQETETMYDGGYVLRWERRYGTVGFENPIRVVGIWCSDVVVWSDQ